MRTKGQPSNCAVTETDLQLEEEDMTEQQGLSLVV